MTSSIQEPCCIENTLPRLLREHALATWQTNGDVTFDKLMKAVGCLAGDAITVTVITPSIDIAHLRYLRWLHQRGWLKELKVLTATDQAELVKNELPAELPMTISNHTSVVEPLLIITGEKKTVVVQGALLPIVTPGHYQYVTYCGNDQEQIDMLTASALSLLRTASRKRIRRARKPKKHHLLKPPFPKHPLRVKLPFLKVKKPLNNGRPDRKAPSPHQCGAPFLCPPVCAGNGTGLSYSARLAL